MAVLLIQSSAGESQIRELTKHTPVAIGRHASNDVRIEESAVQILHGRVSWNSHGYEVVAGSEKGIDVNGSSVSSAVLTLGDCIQVGSVALFFYDRRDQAEAALNGVSLESLPVSPLAPAEPVRRDVPLKSGRREREPVRDHVEEAPLERRLPPRQASDYISTYNSVEEIEVQTADLVPPDPSREPPSIKNVFHAKPTRPGDQDPLRSPLVMSMGIGTLVLVLLSLGLWIVIGRDASQKAYQSALNEMEQQRYSQAITQFEEFLKKYPNHSYAPAARRAMGLSKVEQPIASAIPAWDKGMQALETFVSEHRREKEFPDVLANVLSLAERIAKGAAESAGTLKTPELLKVTGTATQLLQQYSPLDKPPTQIVQEIDAAIAKAEAAILKHNTFQQAIEQIDSSLKAKQPFAAFETRRKLLLKYPDLSTDKTLQARLQDALEAERKLTSRKVVDQAAQTTELTPPISAPPLTLIRQSRTRADLVPGDNNVFTISHESCFAVDSTTGVLRWRRVIGLNTPFTPHPVSLDVLGVLLFDTRFNELQLVRQRDGVLIWRQPLGEPAAAAPLIHGGQIFVPTRGGKLCQLDAVTGKMTAQLVFSQPLVSSPILIAKDERLVIVGERAVFYTLNYRPLECMAVTYTGHAAGSMKSPLLKMGDFLLSMENDREKSAQLRIWDATISDKPLLPLASDRVAGQVHDAAVLRGKQLVVPSSPERLSAFTVSDEKGEKALAKSGTYQSEHPAGGPIYATIGPDDEMWMTSSTLRRLQITPDNIVPQKGELSLGVTTQPVQVHDQMLFATSRLPSNSATYFLAADRQEMSSQWMSVFGSRALAIGTAAANDGSVPLLTEAGDVFTLTPTKLKAGGIDSRPVTTLSLPAGLKKPLGAAVLSNGQIVTWCSGPQAKLWHLNQDGILTRTTTLPESLEATPILLNGGLLLPLPGKLRLIESTEINKPVEDLMSKVDPKRPSRWKGVLALDAKQAIAVTDQGQVIRAQVRMEPVPHVAEVSALELKTTVDQPPVVLDTRVFIATGKTLHCLDVGTLESRGDAALPEVVTQGPWIVGDRVLMVCGRDQLVAVGTSPIAVAWKQKLEAGALAGAPILRGEDLFLASQSGQIILRKLASGEPGRTLSVNQPLASGPSRLQDQTFVTTLDGSLLPLNSWLEAKP